MSINNNSLVLYLQMDAIIGTTSYDCSGNLADATANNASILPDNTFGSCTSFTGTSSFLTLGVTTLGSTLVSGATAFAFTAWVAPSTLTTSAVNSGGLSNVFFSSADTATGVNVALGINTAGQLQILISSNGTTVITVGVSELAQPGWHFVAVSMNGTALSVQLDGNQYTPAATTSGALSNDDNDVITVGADFAQVAALTGPMAHLRVYNQSLEFTDFTTVMNADLANDLMLYLPLSESDGSTTPDQSTYDDPATLVGSPVPALVPDPQFGTVMSFSGSNQYLALSGPVYTPQVMLTGLTAQVWINTSATTAMTLISFDGANYWELGLAPGTVTGTLVTSWTTVDETGVQNVQLGGTVVNDGNWHFISAGYHAGDGTKTIYVDAGQDASTTAHNGLPLGNQNAPTRYGFVGIGSLSDTFNGTTATTGFYSGELSQCWIYHQALTPQNISVDMNLGLTASAAYLLNYPLSFSFMQENQANTMFIYDDVEDQTLSMQISNNSSLGISFPEGSGTAGPSNYQIVLVFRPGTLSDETLNGITLLDSLDWSMSIAGGSGGITMIYLLSLTGYTLYPMAQLSLTFNNVGANATGGSRVTRVEFGYNGLNYLSSQSILSGATGVVLNISDHSGVATSPLQASFLQTDTVWNGSGNNNSLSIRLLNIEAINGNVNQGIQFNGTETDAPTVLYLFFEGENTGATDPAALNTYTALGSISAAINIAYAGGVSWSYSKEMEGAAPYWTFTPLTSFTLPPDTPLQIDITNINASAQAGLCNAYIEYENLPGYLDNNFILTIRKNNVWSDGTHLAIGAQTPTLALSINGGNTGVDTPSAGQLGLYASGNLGLQLDTSGNVIVGPTAATNLTLNSGNLTLTSGNLTLSNGTITASGAITSKSAMYSVGTMNIYGAGDNSSVLNFQTNTGANGVMIGKDSGGNLNLYTNSQPILSINPGGNVGVGIAPATGAGMTVNGSGAMRSSPTTANGFLVVGNPEENYISMDYQNIYAKFGAGQMSSMSINGTQLSLNGTGANAKIGLAIDGTTMLTVSSSGVSITKSASFAPGTVLTGIPLVQWQVVTISTASSNNQSGKSNTGIATFPANVVSAVCMLQSWQLSYDDGDDHHVKKEFINTATTINGTQVTVTLTVLLSDDGNKNNYKGSATVVVLATMATT